MKVDGAGRTMTKGRRALIEIRDGRLATVKQIAAAAGVSMTTIKELITGVRKEPSLSAGCRLRDRFGISVDAWRESRDSDSPSTQSEI